MKEIFTAASVEEAKQLAAQQFGTSEDKITFNVLEEPKKGLFGKIKGEAKVEAEYTESKTDIAVKYIKSVLDAMEVSNASVTAQETQDGAVIDKELAWSLYGSVNVAGMSIYLNDVKLYISGVIDNPRTKPGRDAFLASRPGSFLLRSIGC